MFANPQLSGLGFFATFDIGTNVSHQSNDAFTGKTPATGK